MNENDHVINSEDICIQLLNGLHAAVRSFGHAVIIHRTGFGREMAQIDLMRQMNGC